jgi:hypothetical protein
VAVQLAKVEFWPDGKTVKTAQTCFVVEGLESRSSHTYTRFCRKESAVPSDLSMTPGHGWVEAATSLVGVRLLLGERSYDLPVPASEGPGPLAGIRFGKGPREGGGCLYGDAKVESWSGLLPACALPARR